MQAAKGVFGIKDAPDAPSAADYTKTATDTANSNFRYANINQSNPFQNLNYTQSPDGTWQQQVSLNGAGKGLYDAASSAYSQPFDYSSVGDVQNKAYGAFTSRLDPQWDQRKEQLDTQLANQGISAGSQAYTNAMRDFNTGRNDAYQQANLGAIQTAPQTLQMAQAIRNQPMSELQNWMGAGTFAPHNATNGVDYSGALNAGYQGQLAQSNANNAFGTNMMNGLFSLGGAALGKPSATPVK